MKELIERNYKSIVDRGLISPSTIKNDFLIKLYEEVDEFEDSISTLDWASTCEELADVILVCLNFAKHYNIDIEKELTNKIKINEERAINTRK